MMRKARDEPFAAEELGDSDSGDFTPSVKEVSSKPAHIDVERDKFPFAIVWTPIPCITWFLPFVGHMGLSTHGIVSLRPLVYPAGVIAQPLSFIVAKIYAQGIADSTGAIHDFAGPYYIGYDDMAFGRPSRYLILDPKKINAPGRAAASSTFDSCIELGNSVYRKRMHNLICDNCHSHVACCLNDMRYAGSTNWNMVKLAAWMFFAGKFVSVGRTVSSYLPFTVILSIVIVLRYLV